MEYYNCMSDEYELVLYHHGVKGMKWGVRKKSPEYAKYQGAKQALKQAKKDYRRDVGLGIGWKSIKNQPKAEAKLAKAELDRVSAKAAYKATKSAKAEQRAYVNEISKTGLAGSAKDAMSGGRSTAIYNRLQKEKGKTYADNVMKKVNNKLIGEIAGSVGFAIGLSVVGAMLQES